MFFKLLPMYVLFIVMSSIIYFFLSLIRTLNWVECCNNEKINCFGLSIALHIMFSILYLELLYDLIATIYSIFPSTYILHQRCKQSHQIYTTNCVQLSWWNFRCTEAKNVKSNSIYRLQLLWTQNFPNNLHFKCSVVVVIRMENCNESIVLDLLLALHNHLHIEIYLCCTHTWAHRM